MRMDESQPFADAFDGKGAYRLFTAADAEGASVETSACGFQLDKGLAPVKEAALFGRDESGEIQYAGYAVVFLFFVGSEVTESGHGVPLFRMVLAGQPLWKGFFTFSSEDAVHKWIFAEELFIVSQKFRTAQY